MAFAAIPDMWFSLLTQSINTYQKSDCTKYHGSVEQQFISRLSTKSQHGRAVYLQIAASYSGSPLQLLGVLVWWGLEESQHCSVVAVAMCWSDTTQHRPIYSTPPLLLGWNGGVEWSEEIEGGSKRIQWGYWAVPQAEQAVIILGVGWEGDFSHTPLLWSRMGWWYRSNWVEW